MALVDEGELDEPEELLELVVSESLSPVVEESDLLAVSSFVAVSLAAGALVVVVESLDLSLSSLSFDLSSSVRKDIRKADAKYSAPIRKSMSKALIDKTQYFGSHGIVEISVTFCMGSTCATRVHGVSRSPYYLIGHVK